MSSQKTVREVCRVYQRFAGQLLSTDSAFMRARLTTVQRLCAPVAAAYRQDPLSIESQLLQGLSGHTFSAVVLDEAMLWQPANGPTLLAGLLDDRQLRKRPIARQFLYTLNRSTVRLWHVVDSGSNRWATVRRFGGEETPRRVQLLDNSKPIETGDCVVARRIKLGTIRVFADGWLGFPGGVSGVLLGLQGDALMERAFCLWALLTLGERSVTEHWLESLDVAPPPERHAPGTDRRANEPAHAGAGGGTTDQDAPGNARGGASSCRPPRRATRNGCADAERERLLERIRKLFAMAQETEASPHEAEIALRRCQSLMARFGISEADLETSEFGVASVATGRTVATHVKLLGGAVALLHDVIFVIGRGGLAEFRGYDIDVQVAMLTFDYLSQAIERALSVRKQRGELPPGRSAAFDYRVAFAREVYERVRMIAAEREQAEHRSNATGIALTTAKRDQVDREFGDDLTEKTLRLRGPLDDEAAEAGRADGRSVSLDPQIG